MVRVEGFKVQRFRGSRFSPAAGLKGGYFDRKRDLDVAEFIKNANIECRRNVFYLIYK